MAMETTTKEVFERALLLPVEERAELAKRLLLSVDSAGGEDRSSAEQILARFRTLDARLVHAFSRDNSQGADELDEPFGGARLA